MNKPGNTPNASPIIIKKFVYFESFRWNKAHVEILIVTKSFYN